MIIVEERISSKVPGITSFFIQLPYNKQFIEKIKLLDCKNFSKKTNEWEIPVNELKILLDLICELDDIKIKLLPDNKNIISTIETNTKFKITPFEHQLEAINYGLNHNKWLLLYEMGLGKSMIAIYLAQELKERYNIKHCLIICGVNSLKSNWKLEIEKFSNLSNIILGERINRNGNIVNGSIKERIEQLKQPIDEFFIITNIESMRSEEIIKTITNGPNKIDMIVVDEIHKCKDSQSLQGENLLKLKSTYQLGMTGTPIMNNPLDIYVPLNWIDMDRSTLTNFKNNYCIYSGDFGGLITGYKNTDLIKEQLSLCSLRKTKDILNLPEKNIIPEYLDMGEEQLKFYNEVKNRIIEEVDKIQLNTSSLLALVTRLRQSTACPSILTTNNINSIKLDRACEIAEEIISNNNKVVIFSTFKESVIKLNKLLSKYNPLICHGDIDESTYRDNINKFQNNPEYKLFIGTWQKCGTGITLTAANYMIFIDTPWTAAIFDQACDRIYRIGTKKPVFIYNLICKNTIDERVYDILKNKKAISEYIIDDNISDNNIKILAEYIKDLK